MATADIESSLAAFAALARGLNSFSFLLPALREPVFGNNRVEVTRKAADSFSEVFRKRSSRQPQLR